jgi:hypothetical protein
MHRSSQSISAIASALAKAQSELSNPDKSLTATIQSPFPREANRTFRYASLASGLDIIRKSLGQHEIATIQTTSINQHGEIQLTTLLAHASGEWISSDWPVCSSSETGAPHRMGAALTYARRYALFALVGIAGEDDLDAPDTLLGPPSPTSAGDDLQRQPFKQRSKPTIHKPPLLDVNTSGKLRDVLVTELTALQDDDALTFWAQWRLPAKNTLVADDARVVEATYQSIMNTVLGTRGSSTADDRPIATPEQLQGEPMTDNGTAISMVVPLNKPVRRRSKAHLAYVREQACVVCQRQPCDAHHLKFAEARAIGRKVSDEFTVPMCRDHHNELHRHGNEKAWWTNLGISPLELAKDFWMASPIRISSSRLRTQGIDEGSVNAEILIHCRDLFIMYDSLIQSAQTRRILLLREMNRRRISLEFERNGPPKRAIAPPNT